jgi:cytochrome P450
MLAPKIATVIKSRSTELNESHSKENPMSIDSNGQHNLVSWILGHYKTNEKPSAELLGQEQLLASFAAIHTTSLTVTQALFDLALYPEYVAELRTEVNQVASEALDGKLGKDSMQKLRKLDSFLKESQRVHPLGMGTDFSFH